MWRFIRLTLAFAFGFLLAMGLGVLLLVLVIFAIAKGLDRGKVSPITERGWLKISLEGELTEQARQEPPSWQDVLSQGITKKLALSDLREALDRAAENDKVRGIYLECKNLSGGYASVQELGDYLARFKRRSGKPIYAYSSEGLSEATLYLATLADSIFLFSNSNVLVEWNGISAGGLFLRGLLDKVGITPYVVRVGKYKSAAETISERGFSPENELQYREFLSDIWAVWVDSIAHRRRLSVADLQKWTEEIYLDASAAYQRRLVDGFKTPKEMQAFLAERLGKKPSDKVPFISVAQLLKEKETEGPKIAVVYAEGGISEEEEEINSDKYVKVLDKVREDKDIRAVVFRVSSPGGSALESDLIAQAVARLAKDKPVIVSMGDVAASGGYYISALADGIVAQPTTITGSIGVIGLFFQGEKFLSDYGVRYQVIKTSPYADAGSLYRPPIPAELARAQRAVEEVYEDFLRVVQKGRRFPSRDSVHALAQGRVWSAVDAQAKGLVDSLGSIHTALKWAAQKAGITEPYSVVSYPEPEGFVQKWLQKYLDPEESSPEAYLYKKLRSYLRSPIHMQWIDMPQIR
ncbi:MAG: signal peptide peptidase SppA [Bacteroidia bacterium]